MWCCVLLLVRHVGRLAYACMLPLWRRPLVSYLYGPAGSGLRRMFACMLSDSRSPYSCLLRLYNRVFACIPAILRRVLQHAALWQRSVLSGVGDVGH